MPVETGDPAGDPMAFRRCLGQFATGVSVISTRVDNELAAMTSNSFSSVSLDPPLILWSIKRESRSFAAFEKAEAFAVNILADDQVELSQNFARSGDEKFKGVAWYPGIDDVPILDGVVANLECRTVQLIEGGDHMIIIGSVERYCRYDRRPLLFAEGRYAVVSEHPGGESIIEGSEAVGSTSELAKLTTALFLRAYKSMTSVMEQARQQAGLSLQESILLRAVKTMPGRTLDELLPELLLGRNAGHTIRARLLERGFVTMDCQGRLSLTGSGIDCIDAVIRHSLELEQEVLMPISPADLAATRRVLKTIISR